MSSFNTNKNSFSSVAQLLKTDFHAFMSLGVAKGSRNSKQQKKAVLSQVSAALDQIDSDDFGVRVILLKTKE